MTNEQKETLSLKAAYEYGAAHGLEQEVREIRDMEIDSGRPSTIRRGYIVALFENRGVFEQFKTEHWPFGNTPSGKPISGRYLRMKREYEDFLAGCAPEQETGDEAEGTPDSEQAVTFAFEAHLRDFLARNPETIEPGLRLHTSDQNPGVEFPVDGGRIDLLAVDRSGTYVVIELKLSQGRNKTLGQLLYYMAWVDRNLGNGPCRDYIIASEIGDDLALAVALVPRVSLAKYRMSFAVEPVAI